MSERAIVKNVVSADGVREATVDLALCRAPTRPIDAEQLEELVAKAAIAPRPASSASQNRANAWWLRAQIDGLQVVIALGPERIDVVHALGAIYAGRDWREAVRR